MKKLKSKAALVKRILESDPLCRNDDDRLYLKVLQHEAAEKGIVMFNVSVPAFLLDVKKRLDFTGFETVRRSRQKIQAQYPELAASKKAQGKRLEKETEYRAFAHEII